MTIIWKFSYWSFCFAWCSQAYVMYSNSNFLIESGERGGSVVECRTPEREVRGLRPTVAVLCPWARHFTPRKYWLITQEAMAPSRHDWKIVDWDVKPQHNQPTDWINIYIVSFICKVRSLPSNKYEMLVVFLFFFFFFFVVVIVGIYCPVNIIKVMLSRSVNIHFSRSGLDLINGFKPHRFYVLSIFAGRYP